MADCVFKIKSDLTFHRCFFSNSTECSKRKSNGYTQLMHSVTHIIGNSSSCIDLIFTQQPNLFTSSGVHTSLHNNCHHQITFANINLITEYPPPYHHLICNYSNADILNITKYPSVLKIGVIYFLIIILRFRFLSLKSVS